MALKEDLDRLMRKKPGRVVAIHEDDAREIVRDAIAPLTARIAELEAENAQLMIERNEALAMRRWNIDRIGDGEVLVCRGYHDKGEDCDHERFVPEERLAAAEAALQQVTAERDAEKARADRIDAKLGELNAAVRECLPPVDTLIAERQAAEASLATATSELARLRAEGEAKDRRIAVLTEAMEPFARFGNLATPDAAETWSGTYHTLRISTRFNHEHFRAARTALARAATAREGQADA